MIRDSFLSLLRSPVSRGPLRIAGGMLVGTEGERYRIAPQGIPLFAEKPESPDARQQQEHYDRVCKAYLDNLTYPHTQEYFAYLDRALFRQIGPGPLGRTLEVCCGRGEALALLGDRIDLGVGVDISLGMLGSGRTTLPQDRVCLVQGDATRLPLADGVFDSVLTLGGIHHVNDRRGLFAEVFRVLRPGGRFIWREPVSDFLLWRALRAVIYRLSPALDSETECPLRYRDTVPVLEAAGFQTTFWRTYGFLGFCLFMNSDVLVFNRLFRLIPGIRKVTRLFASFDHLVTSIPGLRGMGLQVIGVATKPIANQRTAPTIAA
jgi:ubiquinone/menaquinone biosynthesis C-methylase UbiE